MMRLLVIPLAAALIPIMIPAVREWVAEKIADWRIKRRRSK